MAVRTTLIIHHRLAIYKYLCADCVGFRMSQGTPLLHMILLSTSVSNDMIIRIVDRVVVCCVSIACVRLVLCFLFVVMI